MLEIIVLGIIQGIFEWLPVSSKSLLILIESNVFGRVNFEETLQTVLFLHIGTFLAAFIYFFKDIKKIIINLFNYSKAPDEEKKLIMFLFISTFISGVLGYAIYLSLKLIDLDNNYIMTILNLCIGLILIITGYLQLTKKSDGTRTLKEIKLIDAFILGIVQGITIIPGLSRSGTTISALLIRKFNDEIALKLSFLMSLPIVFVGNIVLNFDEFTLSNEKIYGVIASFVVGLISIHLLLKLAHKVNFGKFVIIFAILLILFSLVPLFFN